MPREELAALLLELFWSRRERFVQIAVEAMLENYSAGSVYYSTEELTQMVEGFIPVALSSLEGEGEDLRRFYVETLVPQLVETGSNLPSILYGMVYAVTTIVAELVPELPEDRREEGTRWLSDLFARLVADMASLG